jgi:hypothetical protein
MALYHPSKSLSLAETSDIHDISRLKEIEAYHLPWFIPSYILDPELLQMISRAYPSFFEMAG